MLHKSIIAFLIVCVTSFPAFNTNEHNLATGSGQDFAVYYLRTDHPLSKFNSALFPSVEDIILARNHENKFLAEVNGNWARRILNESEYGTSSEDKCKNNNGNCSHNCETIKNQVICSCDEEFSLIDGTDCHPNISGNVLLSGTSGKFQMYDGENQWVIKAPDNHIIEFEIVQHAINPRHIQHLYYVYDSHCSGRQLSPYGGYKYRSSGPFMCIKTTVNWRYNNIYGAYKTGLPYFLLQSFEHFMVVSPVMSGQRCYSVTYHGDLAVYYNDEGLNYKLTKYLSFVHHQMQWKTSVVNTLNRVQNRRLVFRFYGIPKVLMLRECLDIEYSDWNTITLTDVCYNGGTWNKGSEQCTCKDGFSGKHCQNGLDIVCENGGIWNATYQSCMCPPGFVGENCEEGCGPNRYGENCTKICSVLSTECEGAIFCRANVCKCAPGLYGPRCDTPCSNGQYGASCQQYCGKCKDGTPCDIYTGKCYSGCVPGFYPPLCQQTYKVLKSAPEILDTGYRHLKFLASLWNQSGQGQPKFYEVQYKAENEDLWSRLTPKKIFNEVEFVINNLLPGQFYSVRIILIDQDGGSCGLNVPETKVMTKCMEPPQADYSLAAKEVIMNKLTLEWSYVYDRNADLCLVKEFELSLMSENTQFILPNLQKNENKTLSGLLPNTNYRIQLTGITVARIRVPSPEITVHTLPAAPGKVVNVQVVPIESSHELKVTWQPPRNSAGVKLKYHISYTCLRLLACDSMDHTLPTQDMVVETTSALLGDLKPHALYQIKIAASTSDEFASEGYTTINTTTEHSAPHVEPSAAENPILDVTNVSASVSWLPPRDCALLNGYLYGYSYKLLDNETGHILKENTLLENVQFVNFTTLRPNHCYHVEIAIVSSGGAGLSNILVIPFCTSPTGPDQVQFLKVYKRSRKMVGLKWDRPLNTYGKIDSFIISYNEQGTDTKKRKTIKPQHCRAWPDSYCHTVSHLSPARTYSFTVQARNDKVSADGEPASVEAVTSEGVATAPVNLCVINATESSVTLEWQMPDNIDGLLRSFLIMTGQVDTNGASDECCESIPLSDHRVTSEEPSYRYEINGLSAASTYSVTVAAKTLTLGEEARIIVHTQPPKGLLAKNAIQVVGTKENSITVSLKVHPAKRVHGVKRTYLLLLLSNATSSEHAVEDDNLRSLLETKFTDKYHLISTYTQDELEEHPLIQIHPGDLGFEVIDIHSYRYALVLIQDYMGNTSVDISVSELY